MRVLVVDPFLAEFGLGHAFPDADALPRSPKATIAGRHLVLDAVAAAKELGGPWDLVVSRDAAGAPIAVGLVEMGLAERAVLVDPGPGGLNVTRELFEEISREHPPHQPTAPVPQLDDDGEMPVGSPEMAAFMADDDGTDPARAEYARRIGSAIRARMPFDPDLEADGSDARWMYWWPGYVGAAKKIAIAVTARERFMGTFLAHHKADVTFLDVDDVEWLRDPDGFRDLVLGLAAPEGPVNSAT